MINVAKSFMRNIDLKDRTKNFAHRSVKLCMALPSNSLGNHIRNQLIRCSTSVAANYRAACVAQTKAGFVAKLSIVIEEIDEACFWMEFIVDEELISAERVTPLLEEAKEITAISITSRKTAQNNENQTLNINH